LLAWDSSPDNFFSWNDPRSYVANHAGNNLGQELIIVENFSQSHAQESGINRHSHKFDGLDNPPDADKFFFVKLKILSPLHLFEMMIVC
jgi:hypothetical protein